MIHLKDLVDRHQQDFLYRGNLDSDQFLAFNSIRICRTAEADGHLYNCDDCGGLRYLYHSCGHRFCPNCQNFNTTKWLYRQKQRLLPCDYYMITFTIPRELRRTPRSQRRQLYKALFEAASETLKDLTRTKLNGECGALAVLHTNSRNLDDHPHIHFIVPGLVLRKDLAVKITAKFFLHYNPLRELFRGKLLAKLKDLEIDFPRYLYGKKWNVHCEKKGNGSSCIEYLSRYLIKGVVSEKSLRQVDDKISLRYQNSRTKKMENLELTELDFLQRIAQHVKPKGFRAVREYGFLAPAAKKKLARLQILLNAKIPDEPEPEKPKVACPCCGGKMSLIIRKMDNQWWEENIVKRARSPPVDNFLSVGSF